MAPSPCFTGPLYTRMAEDLHLGGMSERTHDGYLRAVRKLADYCRTSPDKITENQLRRFFLHMKNELHYAYGTLRVAYSGIKFFYTRTCASAWNVKSPTLRLDELNRGLELWLVPREVKALLVRQLSEFDLAMAF